MKAEELMIGDWVMVKERKGDDAKDYPIMVYSDIIGDIVAENLIVEPIPLTSEILEKNGFGFLDTYNGEFSSGWTGWWILEDLELGCCDNSKFPVFFNIADTNVKVNYVHELQHALKLCKIKKEIVL